VTDFATGVDRLLTQVRHWEAARWRSHQAAGYALVQRLADLCGDAEGRQVPDYGPLALPDLIRITADDLLAAGPSEETLAAAGAAVEELRQAL
jgi:hypothetical protein